ncbi:neuronal acetylcholine receptor subunit alpha-10-like isoform X2 [Lineus longissimus]|uniref:neuronal acetylcholine receptor subunit alpha-10-like isoform X2 n=1 Tax=Lineus longissimus TaxID=88925 RepID=UPI00315DC85D
MYRPWIISLLLFILVITENLESTQAEKYLQRFRKGGSYTNMTGYFKYGIGGSSGQRRQLPKGRKRKQDSEFPELPRSWEYKIKQRLTRGYDKTSRPVKMDNTTIKVNIAMSLFHILDTNEKHQTFSALVSIRLRWRDEYMVWDKTEYGNISQIHIPAYSLWLPDLVISNHADDSFSGFLNTYAIVQHTGDTLWMFPAVIKIYCTLNVRHFPFDSQHCDVVFISWTYSGFELDMLYNDKFPNTVYYTAENQEWWVDRITVKRHEKYYACCEEPYPDVTFTIHMNRRSLFYIFNLIFPCMLIYVVSMLGFFLPIESGEKVNLEITILLALVVFLMIIGETLPPTPDAIPLLGMLFGATMLMVSIALVMGVIVTNIHLRRYSKQKVPRWVGRKIIRCDCARQKKSKVRLKCKSQTHRSSAHSQSCDIEIDTLAGAHEMQALTTHPRTRANGNLHKNSSGENIVCNCTFPGLPAGSQPNVDDGNQGESSSAVSKPVPQQCPCQSPEAWSTLAKFMDRLFFYIFLIASLLAFFLIFYQIPSHSNEDSNTNNDKEVSTNDTAT